MLHSIGSCTAGSTLTFHKVPVHTVNEASTEASMHVLKSPMGPSNPRAQASPHAGCTPYPRHAGGSMAVLIKKSSSEENSNADLGVPALLHTGDSRSGSARLKSAQIVHVFNIIIKSK